MAQPLVVDSTKILEFLKQSQPQLMFRGLSKRQNQKYEFPTNWVSIPGEALPKEFEGKNVSIAISLIVK